MFSRLRATALVIVGAAAVAATLAGAGSAAIQSAPSNNTPPTISGSAVEGSVLSVTFSGSWNGNGSGSPTFTYQWQTSCDTVCADIGGATAIQYTLTNSDVGHTVRVEVTASNSGGSSSPEPSAATGTVAAAVAPSTSGVPTISGTQKFGFTLTETDPTWTGTAPIAHSYQWDRCDTGGGSCTNIGTDSKQYTLTSTDVGHTIRVIDNASNAGGSSSAMSVATGTIQAAPPAVSVAPAITGNVTVGANLSVSTGTWTGTTPITYTYQWDRCDGSGNNCGSISGATTNHYVVAATDAGSKLRARVTATNTAGNHTATSNTVGPVPSTSPANTVLPNITGTVVVGQTLSSTNGTWTGASPLTYTTQWQRCDAAGNNCVAISGATTNHFAVTTTDVGHTIRVQVTARNNSGTATATSAATTVIASNAPTNTVAPVISGIAKVGQILTSTAGTWTGTNPISYTYQWQRCNTTVTICSPITGATGSTYQLQLVDALTHIRAVVSATDKGGTAAANSNVLGPIVSAPPAGAVKLANGSTSVPVQSLPAGDRLKLPSAKFSAKAIVKRKTVRLTVKVTDAHAWVISGATITVTAAHSTWITRVVPGRTARSGLATLIIHPTKKLPLKGSLVLTIRVSGVHGVTGAKKIVKITLKK